MQALAEGILAGPVMLRQRLVDDGYQRRARSIGFGKVAAAQQRNPRGKEVTSDHLRGPGKIQARAFGGKVSQYRFCLNRALVYARSISDEPYAAGRKMRAGKICRSCKSVLPSPHTEGAKLCNFCAERHLVYLYFRERHGWHCGFRTEDRKKLPREFCFRTAVTVREVVRRGNGLIDKWDSDGFELGLELGKGGVWLRLSDDQYRALGGVL